jgi:hypothetical protein
MAEKLIAAGTKVVRLGNPVRVLPQVQTVTLDALVEEHDDYRQAKKIRKEAFALQYQAHKFAHARHYADGDIHPCDQRFRLYI